MKKLIVLAFIIAVAASQDEINIPPEVPTNVSTSSVKPTTSPVTTPTTPSTTPTIPSTTPTTPSTTPTTTLPTSTTPAPITTKASTTTVAPTVPTTVKPKPDGPEVGTFNVTMNGVTCVVLKMALVLDVPYETIKNGTHKAKVMLPKDAVATGDCSNATQIITLSWNPDNSNKTLADKITFMFAKNETKKEFMLSQIIAKLDIDKYTFPDAKSNVSIAFAHEKIEFITPLKMSYKCNKEEKFNLTVPANASEMVATFIVSKLQVEAFRTSNNTVFSEAENCEPFETPGIVPIAVGCSLAALIIIVLIAYLVGRRRSQARGYLSM